MSVNAPRLTPPLSGDGGYCVMTLSHCASYAALRSDVNTCAPLLPGYSVFFHSTVILAPQHHSLTTAAMAEPVASDAAAAATDAAEAAASTTPGLSPAASPGSEPPSMALSPTADGSQRLLFSHDLVSGRYRGSVRFGLVRMIHGEEDFNSDSDLDDGGGRGGGGGGGGGGGSGGGGGGGGGGRVPCGSDTESAVDTPSRPLVRGFVRVQWYPEGGKQDIRETKVPHTS